MELTAEKKQALLEQVSRELKIKVNQVKSVIALTEEGNTIPFIARYRKEQTGALDEVQIRDILERWNYVLNLEERKSEVLRSIAEQGKLTDELSVKITKATKLQEVEDLYRPYKQKRRTRASVAKEKGLEPLANWMLTFPKAGKVEEEAAKFINEELEVNTWEEAVKGAQDIIAEMVSDDAEARKWIREETLRRGVIVTTVKDEERMKNGFTRCIMNFPNPSPKSSPTVSSPLIGVKKKGS